MSSQWKITERKLMAEHFKVVKEQQSYNFVFSADFKESSKKKQSKSRASFPSDIAKIQGQWEDFENSKSNTKEFQQIISWLFIRNHRGSREGGNQDFYIQQHTKFMKNKDIKIVADEQKLKSERALAQKK